MDITQRVELQLDVPAAIDAVTEALADEGFGILTRIDVDKTLQEKLGVTTEPQVILGACNPELAHRALQADPRVAVLLPCNVVVRRDGATTIVEALEPRLMADVLDDNEQLDAIAGEASNRIRRALGALDR